MTELPVFLELANFVLVGALLILSYRTFTFFRTSEFAQPLQIIVAAFYAYFANRFFFIISQEFLFPIPLAFEVTEVLFVVLMMYGMYRLSQELPAIRRERRHLLSALREIETEARGRTLRQEEHRQLVEHRKALEAEIKHLKIRFFKRELDEATFARVLVDKERELTEVKTRLAREG